MRVRDRNRFPCLPVTESRLAFPAAAFEYRSDYHIGREGALIGRNVVGNLRGFDGVVGRQPDHTAAGRIDVERLSSRIGDADEVRGVLEKRHKDLTLVLDSPAIADVAGKRLPTP